MEDPGGGGVGTVDIGEAVETELPCALADPAIETTPASERSIPPKHEKKTRLERRGVWQQAFRTVRPPLFHPKTIVTCGCQVLYIAN